MFSTRALRSRAVLGALTAATLFGAGATVAPAASAAVVETSTWIACYGGTYRYNVKVSYVADTTAKKIRFTRVDFWYPRKGSEGAKLTRIGMSILDPSDTVVDEAGSRSSWPGGSSGYLAARNQWVPARKSAPATVLTNADVWHVSAPPKKFGCSLKVWA